MYKLIFLLWAGLVAVNALQLTTYSDCGSKHGTVNSISVVGCQHEPCEVNRGNTYSITVNFTASVAINVAHNALAGVIAGIELPFPVTPSNACAGGMQCPISAGDTRVYSVSLTCPAFAPTLKLVSKWHLRDANGQDILCFVIPLEIIA